MDLAFFIQSAMIDQHLLLDETCNRIKIFYPVIYLSIMLFSLFNESKPVVTGMGKASITNLSNSGIHLEIAQPVA